MHGNYNEDQNDEYKKYHEQNYHSSFQSKMMNYDSGATQIDDNKINILEAV